MKLAGLLLVVIMVMSGIGYWYYTDTQQRMAILQENNAKLEIAVQTNEAALDSLQADYAAAQTELTRINQVYAEIRRQNNRLSAKLADMDLGLLAEERPEAMERAVDTGTINANRCFELLSGSPLTEEEQNAENSKDFNKECPWLWPGPRTDSMLEQPTPAN
jgi:septal ring factor EnvC (AmiA/AmiB activator)